MNKQNGYSLVELMMVLAIIGIIAGVAVPSYKSNVQTSARGSSMNELLDIMRAQENYSANNFSYSSDLRDLNYSNPHIVEGEKYSVAASTCADGSAITSCVLLTATPQNGQTGGPITINSRGEKTKNGSAGWK